MNDLNTLAQTVNGRLDTLLSLVGRESDYEYLLSCDYQGDRAITESIYKRSVIFTVGSYEDSTIDRANLAYLKEQFNSDGEIWLRFNIAYTTTVIITVLDMDMQPLDTLSTLCLICDEMTMNDGCLWEDKQYELESEDFREQLESDCRSFLYQADNVWLEEKRLADYTMRHVSEHNHGIQLSSSELHECIQKAYDLCSRYRLVTNKNRRMHMAYYHRSQTLQRRFFSTKV